MPLYDYQCTECGEIQERYCGLINDRPESLNCPQCTGVSKRIISASGVNCSNDDASWVRTVVDVVNKKSNNPATQEFIKNPTRANLKNHLSANGLRHVEPGERFGKVSPSFDIAKHVEKVVQYRRDKNCIRVSR